MHPDSPGASTSTASADAVRAFLPPSSADGATRLSKPALGLASRECDFGVALLIGHRLGLRLRWRVEGTTMRSKDRAPVRHCTGMLQALGPSWKLLLTSIRLVAVRSQVCRRRATAVGF